MSKRFIDTGIFEDSWFMELSKDAKLLWIYLITKCDHAGVIERNYKLFEFHTGINTIDTVIKELGNRIVTVGEHYLFIPKFLAFQYPQFPNSKVKAQESALAILKKHGIDFNPLVTVTQVLPNSYGNDNGNVNDNGINTFTENFKKTENYIRCKMEAGRQDIRGEKFDKVFENWAAYYMNKYNDYLGKSANQLEASLKAWLTRQHEFEPKKKPENSGKPIYY